MKRVLQYLASINRNLIWQDPVRVANIMIRKIEKDGRDKI